MHSAVAAAALFCANSWSKSKSCCTLSSGRQGGRRLKWFGIFMLAGHILASSWTRRLNAAMARGR